MRLTTKGRFAVTAMLDLALHMDIAPIALVTISERQKISLSYLEQLFGRLRKNVLVESTRGPHGGYGLARDASQINIAEIILAVDEPLDSTQCGGREDCGGTPGTPCITHSFWTALNRHMIDFLEAITLQQLVDEQHASGVQPVSNKKSGRKKPISTIQVVRPLRVNAPNSVFALGNVEK